MTDDLERRLRDRLRDAPLPAAPPSLYDVSRRFEREPATTSGPLARRRAVLSLASLVAGFVVVATVAVIAGSGRGVPGDAGASSSAGAREPSASIAAAAPSPSIEPSSALVATEAGVTLSVSFERPEIAPGEDLVINVVIHNDGTTPIALPDACGGPRLSMMIPVPVEPIGRDWDGIEGQFKKYALTNGLGGIDHPEATSRRVDVGGTCAEGGPTTLGPGASAASSIAWTSDLVKDVPTPAGDLPITVTVAFDPDVSPTSAPTSTPPPPDGPGVSIPGGTLYRALSVDGVVHVVGDSPAVVSAGQALDALLEDRRFTEWLAKQPRKTWSTANLFLVNYGEAQGIVPNGPQWEIDLFREIGVPRNWAIGFVHAHTAKLANLTFCNDPCDR